MTRFLTLDDLGELRGAMDANDLSRIELDPETIDVWYQYLKRASKDALVTGCKWGNVKPFEAIFHDAPEFILCGMEVDLLDVDLGRLYQRWCATILLHGVGVYEYWCNLHEEEKEWLEPLKQLIQARYEYGAGKLEEKRFESLLRERYEEPIKIAVDAGPKKRNFLEGLVSASREYLDYADRIPSRVARCLALIGSPNKRKEKAALLQKQYEEEWSYFVLCEVWG